MLRRKASAFFVATLFLILPVSWVKAEDTVVKMFNRVEYRTDPYDVREDGTHEEGTTVEIFGGLFTPGMGFLLGDGLDPKDFLPHGRKLEIPDGWKLGYSVYAAFQTSRGLVVNYNSWTRVLVNMRNFQWEDFNLGSPEGPPIVYSWIFPPVLENNRSRGTLKVSPRGASNTPEKYDQMEATCSEYFFNRKEKKWEIRKKIFVLPGGGGEFKVGASSNCRAVAVLRDGNVRIESEATSLDFFSLAKERALGRR